MKKSSHGNTVLALATSLFALIGICVLFADAFNIPNWGTGFEAIFGLEKANTTLCLGLFIAFLCDCLAILFPLLSFFIKGKGRGGLYLFVAALGIAGATLALFGKQLFISANTPNVFPNAPLGNQIENSLKLGTAFITNAVFMYIVGALGLIGAYAGRPRKNDED